MSIEAKICGINRPEALEAAVAGGAALVGFVFYPRSPRAVTPGQAASLAARAPERLTRVAVLFDPDDETLAGVVAALAPGLLQLHGAETPRRVAEIKERFALPVMKAIKVATAADLEPVAGYAGVVDRLLFDAKAPASMKDALPGGNAIAFDWRLLAGQRWPRPWMLSGGLDADNLAEAVAVSGASAVDVSSGVETSPGVKDPAKIKAFLEAAKAL